ncbi:MAG: hypothetical protein R6V56_01735 [Lentisphaeria bacterium]
MIAEQRLISQIKEFANGLEQEPSTTEHDLAEQFADLCKRFNARLTKCEDLLGKGLRSEAVQEALAPPSLFQLRELLETPEIRKWRNICLDFGMTAPPELDFETIDRLREECSTEQLLQPLLRKFRRLVNDGTLEERVHVLRQLRVHDSENPVWVENLEPLERAQLQEIEKKVEEALSNDDIDALRNIYDDLTDPRRLIPPPDDIREKIDERLRRHREHEAREEGEALIAKLKDALKKEDFDHLAKLVEQWHRLENFADFHPSEDMESVARQAREWFAEEVKKRDEERRFQKALEKLRAVLDRPDVDRQPLEQAWDNVQSFNRQLADDFKKSVPERIEMLRAEEQRRRQNRRIFAAACILIAAIVIGAAGWYGWRAFQINVHQKRLQAMWESEKVDDVESYLDKLQAEKPRYYEAPAVRQYKNKVRRYKAAEAERQAEFEALMAQLQTIRDSGYEASSARITKIMRDARDVAATGEEQRRIDAWERSWQVHTEREQTARNEKFQALKNDLNALLTDLESNGQSASLELLANKIEQGEKIVQEGQELRGQVSPQVRQGWSTLVADLNAWGNRLAQKKTQIEAARNERWRFLATLGENLQSLDAYKNAVNNFVEKYTDTPEGEDLERTLRHMSSYRDALDLNGTRFKALPQTSGAASPFKQARDTLGAGKTSVWYPDLTKCIQYPVAADNVRGDMNRLRSLRFWDWKVLRYREKGEEEWQVLFTPKSFYSREENADDGTRYTLYWGEVFRQSANAYSPQLERRQFDDRDYDVQWKKRPEENLIPAAKFGRRLLSSVPEDRYLEDFLYKQIIELLKNPEIAVTPKAELIVRLSEYAARVTPFENTGLEAIRNHLRDTKVAIPWINQQHELVREELNQIRQHLEQLTVESVRQVQQNTEFNRWLLIATLNRDMSIAGVVSKQPDSKKLYVDNIMRNTDKMWCLLPGGQGTSNRFYALIKNIESGSSPLIPANVRGRAFVGQVLFAPADGQSDIVFLKNSPYDLDSVSVDWPASWPINNRDSQ